MEVTLRILFQYLTGGGGALSNFILLLQAVAREYPGDHLDIVCSRSSDLHTLQSLPNIDVISYGGNRHQEIDRVILGLGGLGRLVRDRHSDVLWSLNLGSYVRTSAPQVLSVNNSHQVYPWEVTRLHPDNFINVAALRWFFRKSLSVSQGVIVQTPIMAEYIRNIGAYNMPIAVVPKAVENKTDVQPELLPINVQQSLNAGLGRDTFTFIYVSTYTPHKNHNILVEAFSILAEGGVKVRAVITINPDELIACGGAKARTLIDRGFLLPIGWTGKSHLKSLYDACDACLMPSLLESLSSAHLEAMQWGKPQITADLPYSRDLCGAAAEYVPAENPKAWAETIRKFMNDPARMADLVDKGHEQMKKFPKTWASAAQQVHGFLERIAGYPGHK
jgi:glycosyltransferase involved in cell wall biosynthesis